MHNNNLYKTTNIHISLISISTIVPKQVDPNKSEAINMQLTTYRVRIFGRRLKHNKQKCNKYIH